MAKKAIYTCICLAFALSQVLAASFGKINFEQIQQQYPKQNAVYLHRTREVVYDMVGDSLVITQKNSKALMLLNDKSKLGSVNYIHYNDFYSIGQIDAFTYVPTKKGYKKLEATERKETSDMGRSVFYDDSKQIEITYPMVGAGAIMTLDYDESIKDGHFSDSFVFQDYLPQMEAKVSVKVHQDIDVIFTLFNTKGFSIESTQTKKGKYTIYEWTAKDVRKGKPGNDYCGFLHLFPHLRMRVGEVRLKSGSDYYFRNTDDLFRYYANFIKQVDTVVSPEFIDAVADITKGCTNPHEKAAAIQYWVQDNIKYVAFEQGFRGFVPHGPQHVFDKRYGDCKDMASLTVGMMKAVGLPCYYTWVGTRHKPYTYEELPTLATDNHMVATFIQQDSVVIMDGTMDMYQYGYIPHHVQGKELLVRLSDSDYKILDIPVTEINKSIVTDSTFLGIEDDVLVCSALKTLEGYYRYEIATALDGIKAERMEKRLTSMLSRGNNTFALDTFVISDFKNRELPVRIAYDFKLKGYVQDIGNELFINMNLDKRYSTLKVDTSISVRPIGNDFKCIDKFYTALQIPSGYELSHLPKKMHFSNPNFGFEMNYSQNGNRIVQELEIYLDILDFEPKHFRAWDEMIVQLNKAYRQSVGFTKIETTTP